MSIICFRLKPAELRFLREYVVQPLTKALPEKKANMGYLVLQERLRDKRDLKTPTDRWLRLCLPESLGAFPASSMMPS